MKNTTVRNAGPSNDMTTCTHDPKKAREFRSELTEFVRRVIKTSANAERVNDVSKSLREIQETAYELFSSGLLPALTEPEKRAQMKQAQLQYREVLSLCSSIKKAVKQIVES